MSEPVVGIVRVRTKFNPRGGEVLLQPKEIIYSMCHQFASILRELIDEFYMSFAAALDCADSGDDEVCVTLGYERFFFRFSFANRLATGNSKPGNTLPPSNVPL